LRPEGAGDTVAPGVKLPGAGDVMIVRPHRLLATCFVLLVGISLKAEARDLIVLAPPGLPAVAVEGAILRPFAAATAIGLTVTPFDGTLDGLKAEKNSDLALLPSDTLGAACDAGLLEKVDWTALGGRDRYLPIGTSDCGVGAVLTATALAWDRDKFQGTPTWADFWDVAKYPGKRGLPKSARGTLEVALMADGVAPADVYRMLRTPDGQDRAFHKLDQLRPYIVWWETPSDAVKLLEGRQILMGTAPTAPVSMADRDGHKRFGIQWSGALMSVESWAIMKGAALGRLAQQVIQFASLPAVEARMTTTDYQVGLVKGGTEGVPQDVLAGTPALPTNFVAGLPVDDAFWRDQGAKLGQRFVAWLGH
jgi:putative spermidine/putrescine transport system substrate-binding protein